MGAKALLEMTPYHTPLVYWLEIRFRSVRCAIKEEPVSLALNLILTSLRAERPAPVLITSKVKLTVVSVNRMAEMLFRVGSVKYYEVHVR